MFKLPRVPLYEYECQACGKRLEVQQRMADAPLKKCPSCGKDELQKLISASAFHLKGGGWYKDLYASSKPGSDSSSGGSGGTTSTKSDSTSSPTTTESKTESKPAASPSTSTGSSDKSS